VEILGSCSLKSVKHNFLTQQKQVGYYLQQAQEQRAKSISISTLDGLGVVGSKENTNTYTNYTFDFKKYFNQSFDKQEFINIHDYLKESNRIEKLAFIRNIIYVVRTDFEENSFNLVIDLLESPNLHDEIQRFSR
jgi:hypothetical protein